MRKAAVAAIVGVGLLGGCLTTEEPSQLAAETSIDVSLSSFSLVAKEGGHQNLRLAPFVNAKVENDFWWGIAPFQSDFNGDGFLDVLYVGTMKPEYTVVATDTGGICGGGVCEGNLARPVLFLGRSDGSPRVASNLLIDSRPMSGQSLARQILVADFNQDGRDDFFIADHGIGTHNGFRVSYF